MSQINYIENFEKWEQGFSFYIPINIRFSETDMFGHVNNVSPFIYFEEARIAFFQEVGLFQNLTNSPSTVPVVADLQCDYLRQMHFGETFKLYVKVQHLGNSSIDLHYLCVNGENEPTLTGRGRIVQINKETGRATSFTEKQRKLLQG
ncbi:acyl-CoA thioesterase [Salirhabdus salicampi]|uniref:acyl-CoA thioesterase n=1 Tax=Salirhabdus salicampi TaxID=476102 RepID=UPI0020C4CC5A|nr:acyl-CoA thioesterase [Salirhabdus salicampi]